MYTVLNDLSCSEQIEAGVIRLYTESLYRSLNALMRGRINDAIKSPATADDDIKILLLLGAILSNAISKDLSEPMPAVRYERSVPNDVLEKRDRMIYGNKKHTKTKGFTSTSIEGGTPFVAGNIVVLYDNARGRDITKLSVYEDEKELLIPPFSRVKFYDKENIGDKTIYKARLIEDQEYRSKPEKKVKTYKL